MKIRSRYVFFPILLFCSLASANVDQAKDQLNNKNFSDTSREIKALAEQGNAAAQSTLADLYYDGNGVTQDYSQAAFWYRKAAEQNIVKAQYNLGNMYNEGLGVDINYTEAASWHQKAAINGDLDAAYNLALAYADGEGVAKDKYNAIYWYKIAASKGHTKSMYNLAVLYSEMNDESSFYWYEKAANLDYTDAMYNLGAQHINTNNGNFYSIGKGVYWLSRAALKEDRMAIKALSQVLPELKKLKIKSEGARIFTKPNYQADVVHHSKPNESAYILSKRYDWYEVYLSNNHTYGFIHASDMINAGK